ncbi:MAG: hypothetical protein ACRD4B_01145, partial [Acidobacteriota bacterium]
MFALAASLVSEQIFFKKNIKKRDVLAVAGLVLLNPAIHYHVIFYVVFFMITFSHVLFTWLLNRSHLGGYLKKDFSYFAIVTVLSLVPYVLMISIVTGSAAQNVSTQIPVNFWSIYYASLDLPFIFSMDTAGHLDLIRHGNYLAPFPRTASLIILLFIVSLFTLNGWSEAHLGKRAFTLTILAVLLLSAWMTLGFAPNNFLSFHELLGQIMDSLNAGQGSVVSRLFSQLIAIFINILRFPHRFQLIYFYAAGVLLTISLVWMRDAAAHKFGFKRLISILLIFLALNPIIANNDYRTAIVSGNAANFVAPYQIPNDLDTIKQILLKRQGNKLFIMPTLESGREIAVDGKRYSFLDKFLTYYLNQPTYYYGVGANTENKLLAFLVYRAISYNEDWWDDFLAKNIGASHILVPRHVVPRELGITYMPDIDPKISDSLSRGTLYRPVYEGEYYSLYELTRPPEQNRHMLVDMEWTNLREYLSSDQFSQENATLYFPLQLNSFVQQQSTLLATDSLERSYYDLYGTRHQDRIFSPNTASLPFANQFVASSNFTNIALSLTTLYSKQNRYNYLHENVPSLLNLHRPQFIGLTKGQEQIRITVNVPEDGQYRLLLHGASKGPEISAIMGGHKIHLQKIPDDRDVSGDYVDFTYFVTDIELIKGRQTINISNPDQNAILIESLLLMPKSDAPDSFESVNTPEFEFKSLDKPEILQVLIKGDG